MSIELHEEPEEEPRKKRKGLGILLLGLLLILGGLGYGGYTLLVPPVDGAQKDMDNNWVIPEETLTAEEVAEMDAVEQIPSNGRLRVQSVGLDVPLGAMNLVKGAINPPGFKSAYWVRNLGTSFEEPEAGTAYVAAHSLRHGGKGPGNYLIDIETEQATVKVGDLIEADGVNYRMTEWRSIPKPDLPNETDLWEDIPGRIVLVTCLQRPDNSASRNNIVIIGMLDE
jgi:hypothetical protein